MVFDSWLDVGNCYQLCGVVARICVARKEDNAGVALLQRVSVFFFQRPKLFDGEVFTVENFHTFASQHFSHCSSISHSVLQFGQPGPRLVVIDAYDESPHFLPG